MQETITIVKGQFLLAFWETLYVTILAMFFAVLIGLPLGVLLVVGEKGGLAPLPGWLMKLTTSLSTAAALSRSSFS